MFFCSANVDLSDVVALSKKSRTQVYSGSSRKAAGPQGTLCVRACVCARACMRARACVRVSKPWQAGCGYIQATSKHAC